MPLITGLEIENFRCFQRLTVDGLTRVNLIVGANNSGKTALLEAVEWVVDEGEPERLKEFLKRRGEYVAISEADALLDIAALAHGHPASLNEGRIFRVRAVREGKAVEVTADVLRYGGGEPVLTTYVGESGVGRIDLVGRRAVARDQLPPARFEVRRSRALPSCSRDADTLSRLWFEVAATRAQTKAEDAFRLVVPECEQIAFVPRRGELRGFESAFVRLKGAADRTSLASLGEGAKRMLAIALGLGAASKSVLLIDEIENGIHYSVQPKLWKFLVLAARDLDVQVFATTHSKDCVEAIAQLHREEPELAADISVHRLEAGKSESVRMDARIVDLAMDGAQEIR